MAGTLLTNARVMTRDGLLDRGWVHVSGDRILAAGRMDDAKGTVGIGGETVDIQGDYVLPGFVDMHVHGGGGGTYTAGDPDQARRAAAFHLQHGTTTTLASLVSAPIEDLVRQMAALRPLVADATLVGIHLEGPYISPARCGAHNPVHLRMPNLGELAQLLDAGEGTIRMITVAPELPHALPFIEQATAAGVVVAIGHTDATYAQARAGIDAGARVGTHLYNAMRGLHHREPGPIAALTEHPGVVVELINDGVHVHRAMTRLATTLVGPDRLALVTDAMAAAGMGDGTYPLGSMTVRVEGGVARLADGGAIAGSTLTMDGAFRRAVLDAGLPMTAAANTAATTPARTLGLDTTTGAIASGLAADLVVLGEDLMVRRVMRAGRWVA
jgi:N-acetylglucosamine-6-phosphate deacetylase